jgi:hypothetical protein
MGQCTHLVLTKLNMCNCLEFQTDINDKNMLDDYPRNVSTLFVFRCLSGYREEFVMSYHRGQRTTKHGFYT